MKIFLLTFVLLFHLCFNFAIASYFEKYKETTDPESCGLQLAVDGAWVIDKKTGVPAHLTLYPHALMYSFDANTHKCIKYNRGGLGNNNNSFYTEASCLKLCRPWNFKRSGEPFELKHGVQNPTDPEVCSLQTALQGAWTIDGESSDPIKLTYLVQRYPVYSFHANTNDCVAFGLSGEGNNKNAFADKESCLKLCRAWNIERSKSDIEEWLTLRS